MVTIDAMLGALAAINVYTWSVYRRDKDAATWNRTRPSDRNARVPARELLLLALCLGIMGASWGMWGHRARHKTRKARFLITFWRIALLYADVASGVAYLALSGGHVFG